MALADQWSSLEAELPADWSELRLALRLADAAEGERAATLLAPLQPLLSGTGALALRIVHDGSGPGAEALRRGLRRLDRERLGATLSLLESSARPAPVAPARRALAEAWTEALAGLPADWSDILGEVELDSSDYLDRAAVILAPLNPRRVGPLTSVRFRSAQRFGYGASTGVVRACLDHCDRDAIHGQLRILRVLCDSRPVGTQGPVWQIDGEMV